MGNLVLLSLIRWRYFNLRNLIVPPCIPNFHIHVSVSDIYIPPIGLPICCRKICRLILEILYINRSQLHECGNWDWGCAIPYLEIFVSNFGTVSLQCTLFSKTQYVWNVSISFGIFQMSKTKKKVIEGTMVYAIPVSPVICSFTGYSSHTIRNINWKPWLIK
jgi:hypothetical protein